MGISTILKTGRKEIDHIHLGYRIKNSLRNKESLLEQFFPGNKFSQLVGHWRQLPEGWSLVRKKSSHRLRYAALLPTTCRPSPINNQITNGPCSRGRL